MHLYVPDDQLRGAFARIHDCDARRMDLPETTFADMPALSGPLSALAKAAMAQDLLMADAFLADLVARLGTREIMLRGGLPAHLLRQIDDWIEAHLDQPIRLDDIAQAIGLSPYHLHRMFRATRGMPLHGWITNYRIARAKSLLAGPMPVVDIAFACGFSRQSHFARVFKAHTTCTPGTYRRLQTM